MNWRIGFPIKHELWWLTDGYVGRWTPSAPPLSLIKSLIKKTIYWACLFLSPILSPIQCLSVAILRNGRPPNKYSPITEPHRGGTPLNRPSPTRKPDMRCCSSGHWKWFESFVIHSIWSPILNLSRLHAECTIVKRSRVRKYFYLLANTASSSKIFIAWRVGKTPRQPADPARWPPQWACGRKATKG